MADKLDALDSIYTATLDRAPTPDERKQIAARMEHFISACDTWLTATYLPLSAELRSDLRRFRALACDTLNDLDKGTDVLIHWPLQRDLYSQIGRKLAPLCVA